RRYILSTTCTPDCMLVYFVDYMRSGSHVAIVTALQANHALFYQERAMKQVVSHWRSLQEDPDLCDPSLRMTCQDLNMSDTNVTGQGIDTATLQDRWLVPHIGGINLTACTLFGKP